MTKTDIIRETIERNQDNYVQFFSRLLQFDTSVVDQGVTGNEGPGQRWLAEQLAQMSAEVDMFEPCNEEIAHYRSYNKGHSYEDRPNVVAVFKGTDSENYKSLILNGHVDVMPPGELSLWTHPPFSGTVKDGVIYGRGAADMKGGICAAVCAMHVLKEANVPLKGDVIIQSVVDEEGGGNGTLAVCAKGYKADGAVILEASNLEIHRASRGAWQFEMRVPGKAIHSSMKPYGVNAIDNAYKAINLLYELERHWLLSRHHPLMSKQTVVIGTIRGGFGASAVPDECVVRGVIEYLPVYYGSDKDEVVPDGFDVIKEVEQAMAQMCAGDPFLKDHPITIDWYQDCPPFYTREHEDIVACAAAVSERVLGRTVISGMLGGCDGRHFQYAGIPVIVWGPGDPKWAHATDEQMDVQEYLKGIEVMANFIAEWTNTKK